MSILWIIELFKVHSLTNQSIEYHLHLHTMPTNLRIGTVVRALLEVISEMFPIKAY